jgi:hypothetical protein
VDVVELVLDVDDVDEVLLVEVEDEELVEVVVVVVLVPELKREKIFLFSCLWQISKNLYHYLWML